MKPTVPRVCVSLALYALVVNGARAAEVPASSWYVKIDGGVSFLNDVDVQLGGLEVGTLSFDPGYGFDATLGWSPTRWLALELDTGLLSNTAENADADLDQLPLLVNGVVQLNPSYLHKWTSYVGAGAGAIVSRLDVNEGTLSVGDTAVGFGVQGLFGLRYAATERIAVGLLYRFRWNLAPSWSATVDGVPGSLDFEADDILSHVAALEVRIQL